MSQRKAWNRCDVCGRFIAIQDFTDGAVRRLIYPDSDRTVETWETLCRVHALPDPVLPHLALRHG
jgi:hypothetical protein